MYQYSTSLCLDNHNTLIIFHHDIANPLCMVNGWLAIDQMLRGLARKYSYTNHFHVAIHRFAQHGIIDKDSQM